MSLTKADDIYFGDFDSSRVILEGLTAGSGGHFGNAMRSIQ